MTMKNNKKLFCYILSIMLAYITSYKCNDLYAKPEKKAIVSETRQKKETKINNSNTIEDITKKYSFAVKFYGVRGSYPKPSANYMKYGGNSSCVEVGVGGNAIIIDAGTGIINLGDDLLKEYINSSSNNDKKTPLSLVMLFSHNHLDHLMGFPFFKPAYMPTTKLYMYGEKSGNLNFSDILANSMATPYFPVALDDMASQKDIKNFNENQVILLYPGKQEPEFKHITELKNDIPEDVVKITCMKSYAHPKDGVLIFKIEWKGKTLVYASDKETYAGGDVRLTKFAKNADVLIHDAQYTPEDYIMSYSPKQGYGHSTTEMSAEIAKSAKVKKLILFHHDPNNNDDKMDQIQKDVQKLFPQTVAAQEGMVVPIIP